MTKKTMYIIGGLIFIFLSLIGLRRKIDSFKTQLQGQIVTVRVTEVPKELFYNDVYYKVKFQYYDNDSLKEYSKDYLPKFCGNLVTGQKLKLKANIEKKIFLYEGEDIRGEFYSMGILCLLGLTLLILGLKNKF